MKEPHKQAEEIHSRKLKVSIISISSIIKKGWISTSKSISRQLTGITAQHLSKGWSPRSSSLSRSSSGRIWKEIPRTKKMEINLRGEEDKKTPPPCAPSSPWSARSWATEASLISWTANPIFFHMTRNTIERAEKHSLGACKTSSNGFAKICSLMPTSSSAG